MMNLDNKKTVFRIVNTFPTDERGYVKFGYISCEILQQYTQNAIEYVDGNHQFGNCGKGLRFLGNRSQCENLKIHKDDIAEFVSRVLSDQQKNPFGVGQKTLGLIEEERQKVASKL